MQKIEFNPENHSYTVDGKPVISVTQLLKKHGLSPDYSSVSAEILNKAADRGTLIHEEIANYINNDGEMGFTRELQDFIRLYEENLLQPFFGFAEDMVGNDIVAGTVDVWIEDFNPHEIKTTSVLHTKSVRWQLSLYLYLSYDRRNNALAYYDDHYIGVFHLVNGGKYTRLEKIPIEEIERLLDCERRGELYTEKGLEVVDKDVQELINIEQIVYALKTEAKEAEERAEALREQFYNKMTEQNIDKFEVENLIRINCIKPTSRESIDSARLKKELPEIAREYTKTSSVKGFLKITLLSDYGN